MTASTGQDTAPAARRGGRGGPGLALQVVRTERLTPHMVRVVLGGPALADLVDNGFTDHYLKLVFPRPGVEYPEPMDVGAVRASMPRADWPLTRTYTIRSLDADAGELVVDFVVHGDAGIAGPWATSAVPGDTIVVLGPGGAYAPAPEADAHVLVGDEAALPAIAASLEQVPAGSPVYAYVEVEGPDDHVELATPGELTLRWCHRRDGEDLVTVVRAATWPAGDVQAFVHGETTAVKELRHHVLDERGVARERLSISGYWRRGMDEDGFQEAKRAEAAG